MKNIGKNIAQLYIKEDTQKALDKATVLKEKLSAFGAEFARQMKQKGEGGTFKWHGKDIALKYSQPKSSKSMDKMTPSQYSREREMARQNMAPSKPKEKSSTTTRNIPGSQTILPSDRFTKTSATPETGSGIGRMIPPSETGMGSKAPTPSFVGSKANMRQGAPMPPPGSSPNAPAVSGVRDFGANPPSSLKSTSTEPSTSKLDRPEVSSALKDKISPEKLGSNPDNLVNKDVIKGREPKPMNESVVNVGANKYRIV